MDSAHVLSCLRFRYKKLFFFIIISIRLVGKSRLGNTRITFKIENIKVRITFYNKVE